MFDLLDYLFGHTEVFKALPCPADRVNRQFRASRPNQLWLADFTYVATWQGFVYVAFVIDAFARRIVGWRVSRTAHAAFVLDALEQALHDRRPVQASGLIHHSDRGVQPGLKWSSQHIEGGAAMTRRRRRSDRSGRAPLFSPGRPVVAGRDQQRRFRAAIAGGGNACSPSPMTRPSTSPLSARRPTLVGRNSALAGWVPHSR